MSLKEAQTETLLEILRLQGYAPFKNPGGDWVYQQLDTDPPKSIFEHVQWYMIESFCKVYDVDIELQYHRHKEPAIWVCRFTGDAVSGDLQGDTSPVSTILQAMLNFLRIRKQLMARHAN